jgi:hypothetical protein
VAEDKLRIETAPRRPGRTSAAGGDGSGVAFEALGAILDLRRLAQSLQRSGVVLRLRNEIDRLKHADERRRRKQKQRGRLAESFTPEQARLLAQEGLLEQIDQLADQVVALEGRSLEDFYAGRTLDSAGLLRTHEELKQRLADLLFELHQAQGNRRRQLTIAVFGERLSRVCELAQAYEQVCRKHGANVRGYWLKMHRPDLDRPLPRSGTRENSGSGTRESSDSRSGIRENSARSTPSRQIPAMRLKSRKAHDADTPRKVLDAYCPPASVFYPPAEDVVGLALQIGGDRATALLETEAGKHEFLPSAGHKETLHVETVDGILIQYEPPADVGRRGSMSDLRLRRTYDLGGGRFVDPLLAANTPSAARSVGEAVSQAVEACLQQRTWALLDPWN